GKKVKCPKCGNGFAVPQDEETAPEPKPAAKTAKAAPAAKKAAEAPAAPKPPDDDDDMGTYAVIRDPDLEEDEDEDEDDEDGEGGKKKKKKKNKVDLAFELDTSIKDPRGPAVAELVKPSNMILLLGSIMCILMVVGVGFYVFPLIFSDQYFTPEQEY